MAEALEANFGIIRHRDYRLCSGDHGAQQIRCLHVTGGKSRAAAQTADGQDQLIGLILLQLGYRIPSIGEYRFRIHLSAQEDQLDSGLLHQFPGNGNGIGDDGDIFPSQQFSGCQQCGIARVHDHAVPVPDLLCHSFRYRFHCSAPGVLRDPALPDGRAAMDAVQKAIILHALQIFAHSNHRYLQQLADLRYLNGSRLAQKFHNSIGSCCVSHNGLPKKAGAPQGAPAKF